MVFRTLTWISRERDTCLPELLTELKQDMYCMVKVLPKQIHLTQLSVFTRRTKLNSSLRVSVWLSRGQLVRTSLCKSQKSVGQSSHLRHVWLEAVNLQRGMT